MGGDSSDCYGINIALIDPFLTIKQLLMFPNLILQNEKMLLRPTIIDDFDGLYHIADNRIWAHSSTSIENEAEMTKYIEKAIQDREQKVRQQLTIIDKANDQILGCSSFENISEEHKRLEIGWTWLGLDFQGKGYNPIAKYLMLRHVFEEMEYERVEFRARETNVQSQKALAKIGAVREGTLRSYFVSEGERHGFVYFSILKEEWPNVRKILFNVG